MRGIIGDERCTEHRSLDLIGRTHMVRRFRNDPTPSLERRLDGACPVLDGRPLLGLVGLSAESNMERIRWRGIATVEYMYLHHTVHGSLSNGQS